ncbi:MAG TPA: prepilin-type N-terminal cleavage/methylation domain-containing protein [Rhizomicrobium sp.]|jgi:general secretion pathway protein J|nr:prepilin-type N-terminal cleavage/methylation domain-containing protein [Rhizomicrobium sp.]
MDSHGRNTRHGAQSGFTLLELLIATTLLAFLSLLLFGGLRFGTRVWEKTETSTTDANRVRAAQLFLLDEITHVYPFYADDTPANQHVDFAGEDQRMTFFAPSKSLAGAMDLITIQALRGKDGVSVVVASRHELAGPTGAVTHHTLIGGLKWFQISYYGSPAPAGATATQPSAVKAGTGANAAAAAPPQWTSVWEGQSRLPLLIRMRAAFANRADWPDLVVSPRTEVDESCVLDQSTKYCQGR